VVDVSIDKNTGALQVNADLNGVTVYINGKRMTRLTSAGHYLAPALPPGEYKVRVEKEGFQPVPERTATVKAGQQATVSFSIVPIIAPGAVLLIKSAQAGAEVFVDGHRLGVTEDDGTLVTYGVPPGRHSVSVRKNGFRLVISDQNFTAGRMTRMDAVMLSLTSDPGVDQPLKPRSSGTACGIPWNYTKLLLGVNGIGHLWKEDEIIQVISRCKVDFPVTEGVRDDLRKHGASGRLIEAIVKNAPAVGSPVRPPTPALTKPPVSQSDSEDRFPALAEEAARLRAIYEKTDTANMDEVDRLLKSRRCQITRIGGLIDRTLDAMHQWRDVELTYWRKWAEVEQQRVDDQRKSLANMEIDQERVKNLIEDETKDHEVLLRNKANMEKYGKRTEEIRKDIDGLTTDIKDSEARLDKAQKDYDELTVQITNMNASITTRLVNMRQNINGLEAYNQQFTAFYETKRKDAQEICNLKQPNSRSPLPKTQNPPNQP
jgi:hypothetical protein